MGVLHRQDAEKEQEEAATTAVLSPQRFADLYCSAVPAAEGEEGAAGGRRIAYEGDEHTQGYVLQSKVSASGLGRFFHLNCHRYLSFSTVPKDLQEKVVPRATSTPTTVAAAAAEDPLAEAIRLGGFEWEQRIITDLLTGAEVLQPSTFGKAEEYFSHPETVDLLKKAQPGTHWCSMCVPLYRHSMCPNARVCVCVCC